MEQIIKKAIYGGWMPENISFRQMGAYGVKTYTKEEFSLMFLDPLFWQALGKACGWETLFFNPKKQDKAEESWKYYALRFHEINLADGFDAAIKYLSDLTTS